jgi:3-oxoacyl-[acyl-carrier protein] reductase
VTARARGVREAALLPAVLVVSVAWRVCSALAAGGGVLRPEPEAPDVWERLAMVVGSWLTVRVPKSGAANAVPGAGEVPEGDACSQRSRGDGSLDDAPLAGKTALVTGASRNIGRAIALCLAGAGADIVVNTLQDRHAAEEVAAAINALGRRSLVQIADIVEARAVAAMVDAAKAAFGSVDILVCNASSRGQVDFLELDHATWRRVIDISLDGTFHLAQATLPGMIAKGWGRIITLGGVSWHAGTKRRAHNLAGKAGLTGLTRALAVEFADRGITANMIAPGAVATMRPASAGVRPAGGRTAPVPREAHVDEIASTALFLAHPAQAYITGQIIHVNGGVFLGT